MQTITQNFVALPSDVQLAITALIVAAVVFLTQLIVTRIPWLAFLTNYAQEVGLALAALFIDWLQQVLPTGTDDVSIKFILFLLALIGVFFKYAKAKNVQGFVETTE